MSTFKSGNSRGASSPLGLVALALGCGCFAFNGCPVDDRSLAVNAGGAGSISAAGSVGTAGTSRGGTQSSGGSSAGAPDPGEGGAPSGQAGFGGQGGTGNEAGSATAGSSTAGSPTAGSGNEGGSPEPGGDGCEDLDDDGVRDCEQTVALNSRFMSDAAGWEPEPTLHQAWDQRDASNIQGSGALLVRNTNTAQGDKDMLAGSRQCLPAIGQEHYSVAANTFIPRGQGRGSAGIAVWFFSADNCVDTRGAVTVQLVSATDQWLATHGTVQAPAGTRSMHIRLVTQKPFEQPSMEALFDDVLVRQE